MQKLDLEFNELLVLLTALNQFIESEDFDDDFHKRAMILFNKVLDALRAEHDVSTSWSKTE